MKEKRSGLGKRFRKGLSLLLTLCLLAGLIPDAVFAEDETNAVTAEAGTEAAAGEAENTAEEAGTAEIAETETETETAAEAQSATEALTETAVTETDEISVETESGTVQETETETETESEATAGLLGSTAAVICGHSNDADTCMVCEVEALIAELPGVDEISAMDTDGQNEVYLQASDICDIYYDDLTEDERELVPNIGDLWEVLDYFSGAISLTATQNGNVSYIDAEGTTQTYSRDYYAVDSDSTTWGTDSTETWYVVNSSVEISDRIVVSGTVNLILEDGCTLTASSGITVNSGNTLIIYGQTSGTGTVSATATESYYAGIGGSKGNSCGTITINGGTVEATGGNKAAGIGGGYKGEGNNIIINGGTVTATGGNYGAGIGGGYGGIGEDITINGGTVTAAGGYNGAGIGGGYGAYGNGITINGGTVEATGGNSAAGIGGGCAGSGKDIEINGGAVKATGGSLAAGIGSGGYSNSWSIFSASITISGGTVEAVGTGTNGAGIGGGWYCSSSTIVISNGTVTATSSSGAGIGSNNCSITISGGYVSASTSTGSYVIGGSGTSSVKITGGYFADTGATLGVSGTGKVYSCDVESGYEVFSNTDEETVTDYPVYVAELIPVRISGTATYGQTLTVITNGLESITGYQWLRNGETISNATATTYTLTADDVGKKISVKVTYGSDSTETSDTVTVEKATPTVSLETKTATYTGNVISIGAATVTLVNSEVYSGDITYIYYTDQACTIPTTADNSGASDEEEAPVNAGTYYVKASIAEQTNYTAATSDAVILTIISAGLTGVSVSQSGTLTYNGKEQTAVVTTSATTVDDSKVTFTYSTSEGGTYSDTVPALTAAGEYTVYYQAAAANYTTVSGYFTVTIAQKTVTASINGTTTKTYDGTTDVTAEQNLSIELKGVETGDTVTASATGYSYASKDVSSENIITVAGISLDGADADNYTLNGVTTATVAGSITAKALTASINSTDGATGKTYDGTTAVTAEQEQGLSITLDGVVGTETVTASAAGYAYNSADAASADTITASGITLGGDDKSNYTLSNTTATISGTITAKEITVTITPNGGTYGDTITAATAVLSDVIEADKNNVPVTLTYTGTANDGSTTYNGTAVPSEAGSYTVTAAISNSNYKLTETTTAAFTVARAASGLSVGAGTAISKTYKDDAFGLNATWSDKVNATATYVSSNTNVATVDESGTVTIVGAGTATITVSVSETANYNSGSVEVTLTVDKKDNILTVTTSSYNVTYGDGTFDLGASVENGTVTYESSNTAVATVDSNGKVTITGVGSATITLNVAASDNYNAASTKVAVTVNPATPGITLTEKSATYTGKTIAIGAAAVTLVNGETYEETSNGAITYTYYTDENCTTLTGSSGDTTSGAESEGAAPVNAGTYYVKASIAANENYTAVTSEAVTLNITAAKLTVTAADKTIAYGDAAPTYTVTYSGFVTGEDERNLGGTLEFTCAYKQYSDKGSYTITPSGYTSGNYNITYATGTLTVKPKAITVTIAAKNSAYGDAIVELTADDDGGIVNNDKDVYFLSTAAASTSNVGTYDITGTALDENYNITFENGTGAYGITARAITVTIDSRSSIYGDTIETLTASVTDGSIASVDTEAEVYSLSTTASETVSVGSYDITGTTENTNYSITFVNETNTYTITAKELTVTVVVADKAYDGTNTASISSATLNNIANDDSVSLVNGTATFASVNVGTDIAIIFTTDFALSGTEAVLANYTLTQPTGVTASIAAATLTADDFTVTQEDAAAAQQGDDSTVTLTTDETADIHFTGNAIAPTVAAAEDSLATAGDYEVTYGTNTAVGSSTGTVTITGKGNYAGTLVYTFNIVDEEAPTGSLTIGSNTWDSFWSAGVTFSLFYQQMQTVTVETSDNDHVAKTEYCLASKAVTSTEELADAEWTEFSGSFDIEPENCCVVYVKITDNSGNSTVINSDGIVLEATAPVITGLEEGQTYCGDVTFTVADANLSAVTVDGETLTAKEDGSYTIAADNETHVVEAADQAGNSTSVRVTVKKDHTYVYICSGDGATITESCEYCSAVSASVTISVPEGEQIYDGSTHEAVLSYSGTLSGSGMASDDETTSDNETASGGETSSDNETTSGGETTSSDETTSGSESVSGDILSVTYTRDGVQADDTIQAGEYTASITYGGRTASVTYTVSKAKVTVTADDVTRDYGVANPTLTFTITEGTLVDGDTENDLGVTLSTTATKESATGTYAITGTSDSQKYDVTVLEGTLKVAALIELPEQNFPDDGAVHKVEVQESITEVPEAFKDIQELNTVDKIAEKLKEELKMVVSKQDSYTGEDLGIAVYDVALMVSYDGGATWVKATEENFPADGLTVILPYPEGTNKDDYDFTVTHMFTSTAFGKTPGDVESPEVTKTDSGIQVTVTGLSPIAIGWTEIETETETETETESESKPSAPWKHGLIPDADGVFRYYINNVFAKDYVGVVPYDGSLFFIKNGLIDFDANELCLYEDVWYYVSLGQVQLQYTGLAMHDGAWFYITDGILDTTVNGLIPYDGERFLFAAGRLVSEYNGLWLNAASIGGDNKWYFLAEGRVCDVSQVVMYDGAWFVVKNGIFDSSCNGTIEYDGAIFTVVNGQLYG